METIFSNYCNSSAQDILLKSLPRKGMETISFLFASSVQSVFEITAPQGDESLFIVLPYTRQGIH